MTSSHLLVLSQMEPQEKVEGGTRLKVTKRNFAALEGISFYKLQLNPNGIREPHWHANADELGYCLRGSVLISMYGTANRKETFMISQGEAFFIPSGTLHSIENASPEASELILQFSDEEPEDFGLSSMFGMFSDAVLGNTWGVSEELFKGIKRSTEEIFFAVRKKPLAIPQAAHYPSIYQFNLMKASPLIVTEGGVARVARQDVWPILTHQALYSLELTGTGMREPHWHPETAEMGYVRQGKGRMSILSASGLVDTYEMQAGDLYFIPKAYPHHIENLAADSPLDLLIFFDRAMPGDIGLTGSVKSFSNDLLAAVFNCQPAFFDQLPTYYEDLFIVKKCNPLDL